MKTLLNHDLCKVRIEGAKTCLYIRMENGQYAIQRPFENDLRGHIGALTLALDVLSGKVLLSGVTTLQEREFKEETSVDVKAIEAPKVLDVPKLHTVSIPKLPETFTCQKCNHSQDKKDSCKKCGHAFMNHAIDGKFQGVFMAKKAGSK
jgi:hypothetical protein